MACFIFWNSLLDDGDYSVDMDLHQGSCNPCLKMQ